MLVTASAVPWPCTGQLARPRIRERVLSRRKFAKIPEDSGQCGRECRPDRMNRGMDRRHRACTCLSCGHTLTHDPEPRMKTDHYSTRLFRRPRQSNWRVACALLVAIFSARPAHAEERRKIPQAVSSRLAEATLIGAADPGEVLAMSITLQ